MEFHQPGLNTTTRGKHASNSAESYSENERRVVCFRMEAAAEQVWILFKFCLTFTHTRRQSQGHRKFYFSFIQ